MDRFSQPQLVVPPHAQLAEGPCWDAEREQLLWVDILAGVVHRLDRFGHAHAHEIRRPVSAVIPTDGDRVVVCRQGDLALLDLGTEEIEAITPLEAGRAEIRTNDAKCDGAGRLWVGTTTFDHVREAGTLYRVAGRAAPVPMVGRLACSNGIGWSPDGKTMYFVDSMTHAVDKFWFDGVHGEISDRRCFVRIEESDGMPDGLCVDVEGSVWVALWGGSCVRRYQSDGRLSGEVPLPVSRVTSCCFGGPSWTDLYITTAQAPESSESLGGAVFRVRPGVAGLPTSVFRV